MTGSKLPKAFPAVILNTSGYPEIVQSVDDPSVVKHTLANNYRPGHTRNAAEIAGAKLSEFDNMVEPVKTCEITAVSEDQRDVTLKNGQTLRVTKEWAVRARPQVGAFVVVRGQGRNATFGVVSERAHMHRFAPANGDLIPPAKKEKRNKSEKGPKRPSKPQSSEPDAEARAAHKRAQGYAEKAGQDLIRLIGSHPDFEDQVPLSKVYDVKLGPMVTLGVVNSVMSQDNGDGTPAWVRSEKEALTVYFSYMLGKRMEGRDVVKVRENDKIVYKAIYK